MARTIKESYHNKVKALLDDMYERKTFHGMETCAAHEINMGFTNIMVELGRAKPSGLSDGRFFWKGAKPSDALTDDAIMIARKKATDSKKKRDAKLREQLANEILVDIKMREEEQASACVPEPEFDSAGFTSADQPIPFDIRDQRVQNAILDSPFNEYSDEQIDMMAVIVRNSKRYKVYRIVIKEDLEEI